MCVFIVLDEPLELLRVVRGAIVGGPGVADGEFVKLQHIHHPDLRHRTAKQVWALVHTRRCASKHRHSNKRTSPLLHTVGHSLS